jgi:hypothetical protein
MDKPLEQPIIQSVEMLPKCGWSLQEKASPALRVRIARQAGQILEGPIGAQEGRGFQAVQPQQYGIDQGQEHLGKTVVITRPTIREMPSQKIAQLQHSGKFVEEENAAIVRQAPMVKRDFHVFRRSAHPEPHFTQSAVRLRTIQLNPKTVNKGSNPNGA